MVAHPAAMTSLPKLTTRAKQVVAKLHVAQPYVAQLHVAQRHDISQSHRHARKWALPRVKRLHQYLAAFESHRIAPQADQQCHVHASKSHCADKMQVGPKHTGVNQLVKGVCLCRYVIEQNKTDFAQGVDIITLLEGEFDCRWRWDQ
jgi:hypothetical protein